MKIKRIEVFTEELNLPWNRIDEDYLVSLGEAVCDALDLSDIIISLIVCTDEYIHTINRDYRKKDSATDVVSFAYREDPFPEVGEGPEELGDIYLSLERAAAQAVEYEVTLKEEIKRLLIHGILHLIGFDHETSAEDEEEMRQKEEELFDSIEI